MMPTKIKSDCTRGGDLGHPPKIILKVLQQHHWNRKQAARTLSISYRALLYKIRDAGLPSNRALRLRQAENNTGTGAAAD